MSKAYQEAIKKRAVQEFVKTNSRSPNSIELRELLDSYNTKYPTIDIVGFSGTDVTKPQFRDPASATKENLNREALVDDMEVIAKRVDLLNEELETRFRSFDSTARRTKKLLQQEESRVDNLLLLNNAIDVFVYGIEETFTAQDKVIFDQTTAAIESGFCTLGRTGYTVLSDSQYSLTTSVLSDKGTLALKTSNETASLKVEDGSFWEALVYTVYKQGRVTLVLEAEFDSLETISDLRFTCNPINSNSILTYTVLYSLDGSTFTVVEPAEVAVVVGENQVSVGKQNVKKLRVLLSKTVADDTTTSQGQNVYVFSLDSFKIYSDEYESTKQSTVVSGPYEVVSEIGEPIYFTKAKIDPCLVEPPNTAVSFFLSQDGISWIPVSHDSQSLGVASFGSSAKLASVTILDSSQPINALTDLRVDGIETTYAVEGFLNQYIDSLSVDSISQRTLQVKRNVPDSGSIYGVAGGWYFDSTTSQYNTTFYVGSIEGRWINFGNTSAVLDGRPVTGTTKIQPGYHTFVTSDTNWFLVEEGLTNLDELKQQDPVYPFNHKLLIEGYGYSKSFTGERIYSGVDSYFGRLLEYVTPERFHSTDSDLNLGIYTTEDIDGNLYFLVKVNKSDASWKDERYEIDYMTNTSSTNLVYVKAILTTDDAVVTPKIDSFKVRVI